MRKDQIICYVCEHDYLGKNDRPGWYVWTNRKRMDNLEKLNSDENQVRELILIFNAL